LMGAAYATAVLGIQHPRIGLLNIGEEAGKGNQLVKRTYALMKQDIDNFVGNVEGKHMFEGHVDVVVCDAFVGNIVLKTGEGIAEMIMDAIKESLPKSPLLRLPLPLLLGGLQSLKKNLDYAEYGGAPLLGVNGVFIICHGRSDEKAIRIAILHAQRAVKNGLIDRIRTSALAFRREKQHA
jgi:glycerol-3-phosphate acyltransferase PlsX